MSNPLACTECDLVARSFEQLRLHYRNGHRNDIQAKNVGSCSNCHRRFKTPEALEQHVDTAHPDQEDVLRVKCIFCDLDEDEAVFEKFKDLRFHYKRVHKNICSFEFDPRKVGQCYLCTRSYQHKDETQYPTANALRQHVRKVHWDNFDESHKEMWTNKTESWSSMADLEHSPE